MANIKNHVSKRELVILEVVQRIGPCTVDHVHEKMEGKIDLLPVMRLMHGLMRKGYLKQIVVDNNRLYKTKGKVLDLKKVLETA